MRLAPAFFVAGIGFVALCAGSSCGPTPNTGPDYTVTFSHVGAGPKAASSTKAAAGTGGAGQGGAGGHGGHGGGK